MRSTFRLSGSSFISAKDAATNPKKELPYADRVVDRECSASRHLSAKADVPERSGATPATHDAARAQLGCQRSQETPAGI